MFRRKEDGTEELIDEADNDNIEESDVTEVTDVTESVSFPTAGSAAAPAANAASASAPAAASNFRPAAPQAAMAARPAAANQSAPATASSASSSAGSASAAPAASSTATPSAIQPTKRVLTVGPDIQMKGEITTCDRVVIEGVVDATMKDVHTVELAQSGSLKGTAEVEDAEISGIFEGDLVVHGPASIPSKAPRYSPAAYIITCIAPRPASPMRVKACLFSRLICASCCKGE